MEDEMTVKPGDIIVTESQTFRDAHVVCRVVKVGKVMWEVETYRKDFRDGWAWERPARRKVNVYRVWRGNDLDALAEAVSKTREAFWKDERARKERYHREVLSLAGLDPAPNSG